jgi:hypothetical protein
MNSTNGFRRTKGDFLRAAASAAVLIAAAIGTAALWAIALSDSGAPSASSSQPVTAGTSVSLASLAVTVGGVLVAVMVVVLTVGYVRRRIAGRRAGGRRGGMHAKAPGPRPDGATNTVTDPALLKRLADTGGSWSTGNPGLGPLDLPAPAAGPPEPEDEYPSWPGPPGCTRGSPPGRRVRCRPRVTAARRRG